MMTSSLMQVCCNNDDVIMCPWKHVKKYMYNGGHFMRGNSNFQLLVTTGDYSQNAVQLI